MSAIEDAAYNTVHDYPGGAEALAPRMEKSAKVLDSKVNRNEFRHHLTLREAVQIMGLTGDHRMLRAMVYEGIADEQLLELVAAVHSETGDVSRSLVAALADGRVTESEFEAFDQQTHEAMSAIADLRDRLRGMVVPESTLRRVR